MLIIFLGVFSSYGGSADIYVDVMSVPELKVHEFVDTTYVLGANTSLAIAMELFTEVGKEKPQFAYLTQLDNHIDLVANVPVRNVSEQNFMAIVSYHIFRLEQ